MEPVISSLSYVAIAVLVFLSFKYFDKRLTENGLRSLDTSFVKRHRNESHG